MKVPFKLVQTGDLHLGSPFSFAPEQAASLQKSQLETFFKIIRHCQEIQADVLLLTGDVFDQPQPESRLVREVIDLLNSLNHTKVLIAPGNHDPLSLESPYRTSQWPDFVTIFNEELSFVTFAEHQVRIYGIGFSSTVTSQPLLSGQSVELDPAFANLLVIHGELDGAIRQSAYNAITLSDLAAYRFDYVAMGHIHQYSGLLKSGQTLAAYAGCPFGRGFDETGAKGLISGSLQLSSNQVSQLPGEKPRPITVKTSLEFVTLGSRQFVDLPVDISGITEQQALVDHILDTAFRTQGESFASDLYKIRLVGTIDASFTPSLTFAEQHLTGRLSYFKLRNQTRVAFDLDALATEHTLRGAFVRQSQAKVLLASQKRDPRQLATAEKALEIGILAIMGEDIAYVAE